jgi:hypothetical protein
MEKQMCYKFAPVTEGVIKGLKLGEPYRFLVGEEPNLLVFSGTLCNEDGSAFFQNKDVRIPVTSVTKIQLLVPVEETQENDLNYGYFFNTEDGDLFVIAENISTAMDDIEKSIGSEKKYNLLKAVSIPVLRSKSEAPQLNSNISNELREANNTIKTMRTALVSIKFDLKHHKRLSIESECLMLDAISNTEGL